MKSRTPLRMDLVWRWLTEGDASLPGGRSRKCSDAAVLWKVSPFAKLLALAVTVLLSFGAYTSILRFYASDGLTLRLPVAKPTCPTNVICAGHSMAKVRAPLEFVALVTTAYSAEQAELAVRREREYILCLEYFFERFNHVYGLAASIVPWPLMSTYPWQQLEYYVSPYKGKSAKESDGLRFMVSRMIQGNSTPSDDAVVFKASGRYQVVRSDFLEEVIANPQYDAWCKTFGGWTLDPHTGQHIVATGDSKAFTFYWAMRWRHFRDLYLTVDLDKLESFDGGKGWIGYDIESYVMDYISERQLRYYQAKYLHVVANIDNRGFLAYF